MYIKIGYYVAFTLGRKKITWFSYSMLRRIQSFLQYGYI